MSDQTQFNQSTQPAAGGSKTGMWVALIIVLAVLGVGAYFLFGRDNGTNTNGANTVVNSVANTNSSTNALVDENANSAVKTNEVINQNTNESTNTNVDTSDLEIYQNNEYGLSISYPSEWEIYDQKSFCAEMPPTDCTNTLVNFTIPQGGKSEMRINYRGDNPDGLTINEWHRDVDGRSFDLQYEVQMGDFVGYSVEDISSNEYRSTAGIYFSLADKVFDVYWYDQEKRDEAGFEAFISALATFKKM